MIKHGGNVVMARATKQKIQARSSTEAEIIAAEEAVTFTPFLRQVAEEMAIPVQIELREMVGEGKIKTIYVPTEDMVADVMTKPLPARDFVKHKENMGIKQTIVLDTTNNSNDMRNVVHGDRVYFL